MSYGYVVRSGRRRWHRTRISRSPSLVGRYVGSQGLWPHPVGRKPTPERRSCRLHRGLRHSGRRDPARREYVRREARTRRGSGLQGSVVEDVPADRASMPLVIKDQLSNHGGNSFSLPVSFPDARRLGAAGGSGSNGCPDRVGRSSKLVGCDVGHRHSLPGRERGELRRLGQSTRGGIRHESGPVRVTHAHLAADPGTTDVDSVARASVARVPLLEKVQDVFGAEGGPLRKQPVVFVGQCSAAAYGDQSGVTLGWQDRHPFILSRPPRTLATTGARTRTSA